jgi:hypothetical protein
VPAFMESGRQDSNLRSSAPKADALAATLRPGRPGGPNVRDECRALDCVDQSSRPDPPYGRLAGVSQPRRIAAAQREPSPGGSDPSLPRSQE